MIKVLLTLLFCMEYYYTQTAYGISNEAFSNLIDWIFGIVLATPVLPLFEGLPPLETEVRKGRKSPQQY